jgi:hypothetical protein
MSEHIKTEEIICRSCDRLQMNWFHAWGQWCAFDTEHNKKVMNYWEKQYKAGCCFE